MSCYGVSLFESHFEEKLTILGNKYTVLMPLRQGVSHSDDLSHMGNNHILKLAQKV